MPIGLPESVKTVLEDKAYGHVVTFNPNGRPQVTMVWMDVDVESVAGPGQPRSVEHCSARGWLGAHMSGKVLERDFQSQSLLRPRR